MRLLEEEPNTCITVPLTLPSSISLSISQRKYGVLPLASKDLFKDYYLRLIWKYFIKLGVRKLIMHG
jgi:hypothetical protein